MIKPCLFFENEFRRVEEFATEAEARAFRAGASFSSNEGSCGAYVLIWPEEESEIREHEASAEALAALGVEQ